MILTRIITTAAMASPRTNLLAPSMAPKKLASRPTLAAGAGLVFVDKPSVHVRVNGHLFAGHGVQSEARGDFRDAAGAVGDHHELDNDHENQEHDDTDDVVAPDHEVTEGGDDAAGVAVEQDEDGWPRCSSASRKRVTMSSSEGKTENSIASELWAVTRRTISVERDVCNQQQVEQLVRHRHDQHDDDQHGADGN